MLLTSDSETLPSNIPFYTALEVNQHLNRSSMTLPFLSSLHQNQQPQLLAFLFVLSIWRSVGPRKGTIICKTLKFFAQLWVTLKRKNQGYHIVSCWDIVSWVSAQFIIAAAPPTLIHRNSSTSTSTVTQQPQNNRTCRRRCSTHSGIPIRSYYTHSHSHSQSHSLSATRNMYRNKYFAWAFRMKSIHPYYINEPQQPQPQLATWHDHHN